MEELYRGAPIDTSAELTVGEFDCSTQCSLFIMASGGGCGCVGISVLMTTVCAALYNEL